MIPRLLILCLLALTGCVSLTNQTSVTLTWNRSPDANVTGYNLYCGTASRAYTQLVNVGNATHYRFANLTVGADNFFAATAYNVLGMESDYSAEAVYFAP